MRRNRFGARIPLALALCLCVICLPIALAVQQSLVYDANGNLITGDGRFREYNAFNQLIRVRTGNSSSGRIIEEYIYHPTEERVLVKKIYNGSLSKFVVYVNDNFVRDYGNLLAAITINDTYYVRDDSGIVGETKFNGTKYTNRSKFTWVRTWFYHNDLKGSVAVITNGSGSVLEQNFYDPFGNFLQGGNKTKFSYEAKEFDSRAGAFDFHFRQYKPDYGKFTQPDTLIQNVYDPQLLNRYAFERNNPYKNKDPNGHCVEDFCIGETILAVTWITSFVFTEFGSEIIQEAEKYVYDYASEKIDENYKEAQAKFDKEQRDFLQFEKKSLYVHGTDFKEKNLPNQPMSSMNALALRSVDQRTRSNIVTSSQEVLSLSFGFSYNIFSNSNQKKVSDIRQAIQRSGNGKVTTRSANGGSDITYYTNPKTGHLTWR